MTGRTLFARAALAVAIAGLGCSRPDPLAEPKNAKAADAAPIGDFVTMTDANAMSYFVRDVVPELQAGAWRWTNQRPEIQFRIRKTHDVKFTMDFTIPEATFQQTGPISITYYVNGRVLDKVKYATPGRLTYEKPVPAEYLDAQGPNTVSAEVDKPYVAPNDTQLGFILVSAGLR